MNPYTATTECRRLRISAIAVSWQGFAYGCIAGLVFLSVLYLWASEDRVLLWILQTCLANYAG